MAIASSGNCVFGTIINDAISTWSAKRDLGADCAGSIAFIDPVTVAALDVRDVSEYSNLTVPVAGTLGTPTASNNSISFAVNFTATASAPIESYEVSRNGTILNATVLAPLTSYTDNTALNGTSYTYSLRAQNSIGYSTSVSTSAATSYALPEAPSFPILEAGDSQISIGWLAPSITTGAPISGYRLYRSADTGPYLFVATITPETTLTYNDTTLDNGTAYSYQLESYGTGGTSTRSPPSSSATPTTIPTTTPELTASVSNLTNTLSWTAVNATLAAPVTDYLLQTSPDGTSSWNTVYTGTDLTYAHTELINGTDYFYRVAASNTQGTGAYSSTLTSTPIAVAASPTNLTATPGSEEVNLSWTPITSTPAAPVSGYYITKATSTNGPFILELAVVGATSSSATSTGLSNGTTYFYQISSYGAAGTGSYSAIFPEAGVTPSTVPSSPTLGTATVTNATTISLPFTQSSDGGAAVTSYTVTSTPSISLTYSGTTSPIVITGSFVKGADYTFTLSANNSNGASTASTQSNSVTPHIYSVVSGGTLTSDGTYYYRTFTSSGTFDVTGSPLTADVLVVAGGGGGGYNLSGGAGAGGLRSFTSQTISTSQAVIIGAGGTGSTGGTPTNGANSSFGSLSATGGGYGQANASAGIAGGSGGGAGSSNTGLGGNGNLGNYSPVEGYKGGNSINNGQPRATGGGGGAGGPGGNASSITNGIGGIGGIGSNAFASWAQATNTGDQGYYAGGGGGTGESLASAGGLGGGGTSGAGAWSNGADGIPNTGGGGGGGGNGNGNGGNGGSGIVIIRYLIAQVQPSVAHQVQYLMVAGGGGGGGTGAQFQDWGGGGGAGGLLTGTQTLLQSVAYNVVVGQGGSQNTNGGNSRLVNATVIGGGAGGYGAGGSGSYAAIGKNGGSGGGGSANVYLGGKSNQGYNGGTGSGGASGGGGGSTSQGGLAGASTGGLGGAGTISSITGSSLTYAAGGGGGALSVGGSASSGAGAGAAGSSTGQSAQANTGSGGGGSGSYGAGGSGGSGVVVLKYSNTLTLTLSGTLIATTTQASGYKITTITSGTGSITLG